MSDVPSRCRRVLVLLSVLTLPAALAPPGACGAAPEAPASAPGTIAPPTLAVDPPVGAAPGPARSIDEELEDVMSLFRGGRSSEAFAAADRFLALDERPDARREGARRARMMVGRLDEIRKLVATTPAPEAPVRPSGAPGDGPRAAGTDGEIAQLLYLAGQACEESGAVPEALKLYERIAAEMPRAVWEGGASPLPVADAARDRIRWHSGKHPWVQPDLESLIARLRAALAGRDPGPLAALIGRIGFWSGPFRSEAGPDDPQRILGLLASTWPAGARPGVSPDVEGFSDRERQVFLKTTGWRGELGDVYFVLEKVPDGWQWIGAAFAPRPEAVPVGNPGR
jgi:hypothetical protein